MSVVTDYHERFQQWIQTESPPWGIGEVQITPGFEIRHEDDAGKNGALLDTLSDFATLREMLKYTGSGEFRPVRGYRGLKRGWRMTHLSLADLLLALNWIYPAAIAFWLNHLVERLPSTEFRETAARQTGMYRIVQTISNQQLQEAVTETCESFCLRKRLWQPHSRSPCQESASRIPLLCPEACNYFTAKIRNKIIEEEKETGF